MVFSLFFKSYKNKPVLILNIVLYLLIISICDITGLLETPKRSLVSQHKITKLIISYLLSYMLLVMLFFFFFFPLDSYMAGMFI